jgi:hypothetical protein
MYAFDRQGPCDTIDAGHGRRRTAANPYQQCWKACRPELSSR